MEHIWTIEKWLKNPAINSPGRKTGLRTRCDKDVDPQVRKACLALARWLRKEFIFPVRICLYIKSARRIKALDGTDVCGTIWLPDDYAENPYIRIAAGDYEELCAERGTKNALCEILLSICHELTHYFQWINGLKLTPTGEERQATNYSYRILNEFLEVGTVPEQRSYPEQLTR